MYICSRLVNAVVKILTGAKNEFKLPVLRGIQATLILLQPSLQPVTATALCRGVNAAPSIVAGGWAEMGEAVLAHRRIQKAEFRLPAVFVVS